MSYFYVWMTVYAGFLLVCFITGELRVSFLSICAVGFSLVLHKVAWSLMFKTVKNNG